MLERPSLALLLVLCKTSYVLMQGRVNQDQSRPMKQLVLPGSFLVTNFEKDTPKA